MAEKTEKATPKKLRDARKKGQVAKSQDFPSAATFIVSIATALSLSGFIYHNLAENMIATFRLVGSNPDMQYKAGGIITQSLIVILMTSLPIMVTTLIVGVIVNFLVVGPMFAAEAMKPDIKRLNPITNIKNLFKFKTLFELLKSLLKITGAVVLIYTVIWNKLPDIVATAGLPVLLIAQIFGEFLLQVIIRVGIFFLFVAVLDLVFQKRNFAKEMKMEKFEVKQEMKDTEGDPQIKSKRRQTAQEIAYQEGPAGVKRAKAVITNPIHIAVALSYNPNVESVPKIITMGKGVLADLIIQAAQDYKVPIMRNVELAQKLFEKGMTNDYIPEETYQAVAEIMKWLEGLEATEQLGKDVNIDLFK